MHLSSSLFGLGGEHGEGEVVVRAGGVIVVAGGVVVVTGGFARPPRSVPLASLTSDHDYSLPLVEFR